jgi:hypothetical protein
LIETSFELSGSSLYWPYHADQLIELDGTRLYFGTLPEPGGGAPAKATRQTGYAYRFTEAFFKEQDGVSPAQWALFSGHTPQTFALGAEQAAYLTILFQKMLAEQQTPYLFRHALLRNYLRLILYEALRLRTLASRRFFCTISNVHLCRGSRELLYLTISTQPLVAVPSANLKR